MIQARSVEARLVTSRFPRLTRDNLDRALPNFSRERVTILGLKSFQETV